MANIELTSSDVSNLYFGTRQARYVFLGQEILHVKDRVLYSARTASTVLTLTISSGDSVTTFTDTLTAGGANV